MGKYVLFVALDSFFFKWAFFFQFFFSILKMKLAVSLFVISFLAVLADNSGRSAGNPVDPCSAPKVVGRCKARALRFYFDKRSMSCKKFYYGGCGGNGNNFKTKSDCQLACAQQILQ